MVSRSRSAGPVSCEAGAVRIACLDLCRRLAGQAQHAQRQAGVEARQLLDLRDRSSARSLNAASAPR